VSKSRITAVTLVVLGLLMSLFVSDMAPAAAADYGHVIANNPNGNTAAQRRIATAIIKRLNGDRRGNIDQFSVYSIDDEPVANAAIRASRRGAGFRLIDDAHYPSKAFRRLRRAIGTNVHRRSWTKVCRGSCRGPVGGGVMHSKIYLFSRGHVVMEGSANLTGLSMKGQFNELFVSNNLGLYRQFRKLFYLMRRDRPSGYRTFSTGPFMIQAYPASVRRSNDPIMRTLNGIGCRARRGYGYRGHTVLRIMMHGMTGDRGVYLARKVLSLKRHGCNVRMIWGNSIGSRVKHILRGVPHTAYREGHPYTHGKVMICNGACLNHRLSRVVWNGSTNWSSGSARRDDIMTRIHGTGTYRQYKALYDWTNRQYRQ
jgi:hypothetical protein